MSAECELRRFKKREIFGARKGRAEIERWHRFCSLNQVNPMKKNTRILKPRQKLSFGDLVLAVSSCTKDTKETVIAVAALLASGQVRLESGGRWNRARVC